MNPDFPGNVRNKNNKMMQLLMNIIITNDTYHIYPHLETYKPPLKWLIILKINPCIVLIWISALDAYRITQVLAVFLFESAA